MMNPLIARFEAVASMVAPEFQARFESSLQALHAHAHRDEMLSPLASADDGFWPEAGTWRASLRPYVVVGGVLQIPVKGILLHDFSYAYGSYATGYVYIRRAFERGLADPAVKGIALVCDSPGGEVAGNFDLVDVLFAARGRKPVRAFAHEGAYSAAYSIASAADQIVVSRTGGVGSIGVVTAHMDVSKAMDEAGVRITFVYAGSHKVDGNRYEPLPDAVKARMQARIDTLYGVFVGAVARNRGLKESQVRATEALTYSADEAIEAGLADQIGSLDDAIAAFAAELNPEQGDESMDEATHQAAVTAARQEGHAAGHAEGLAAGREAGTQAGAEGAKTRIKAILGDAAATGREAQARAFAFDTDIPAEQAVTLLGTAPKAETASAGDRLDASMSRERAPDLGDGQRPNANVSDFDKGAAEARALLGKR